MKPAGRTAVSKSYPFHIKLHKRASWQPPLGLPWLPLSPFPPGGNCWTLKASFFCHGFNETTIRWNQRHILKWIKSELVGRFWILCNFRNGICMYYLLLFVRLEETKCLEEISALNRRNFTISLSWSPWSTFLRDWFGQPSTIPWIENPTLDKMYQYILKICRSTSFVSDFSQTRPFKSFFHHPISHIFSVAWMAPANWINWINWIQVRTSSPEQHLFLGYLSKSNLVMFSSIPSGKRLHNELENHHVIAGKIHYFDWVIFNSYVTNYQRVSVPTKRCMCHHFHQRSILWNGWLWCSSSWLLPTFQGGGCL